MDRRGAAYLKRAERHDHHGSHRSPDAAARAEADGPEDSDVRDGVRHGRHLTGRRGRFAPEPSRNHLGLVAELLAELREAHVAQLEAAMVELLEGEGGAASGA